MDERSPKKRKTLQHTLGYGTSSFKQESQLSALLSGVSKELSPPYSPQQVPDNLRVPLSTSDVGIQVNLDTPQVNRDKREKASEDLQAKLEPDGDSLCGIPLGNEAALIDSYVPTYRFPCGICGKRVIRSPIVTTCSSCMNESALVEKQTKSLEEKATLPNTANHSPEQNKATVDLISYGSDDGEKHPGDDFVDEALLEPYYDFNDDEERSKRDLGDEDLPEPETYDEPMQEDPQHPYLHVLHWQQDMEVQEDEIEFTARQAYDMLLKTKFKHSSGEISRRQYYEDVDYVRQNLNEPLLFALLALEAGKDVSEKEAPEKEVHQQGHFASVSDRGRQDPSVPREELLLKRVQDSHQEVEDLKIRIRHMSNDMAASKKEYQKTLRERDEKIVHLNENLESSKKIGQRKIHSLDMRNKELLQKQKERDLDDVSARKPPHQDQNYHQLQQEFHAIRRDKSDWLSEKKHIEERAQRLYDTVSTLQSEKTTEISRVKTFEKQNEVLKQEVGRLEAQRIQNKAQEWMIEKYPKLKAENGRLQRINAELQAQLERSKDEASQIRRQNLEVTSSTSPNDFHTRVSSPVPDITDYKPVAHQDWLSGLPLCCEAIDIDAKRAEIAGRPRKKYEGLISAQTRKERGENVHIEPLRWKHKARRNPATTTRKLLAVAVPRDRLSSEERSTYSSHVFSDDEKDSVESGTIHVANTNTIHVSNTFQRPGAQKRSHQSKKRKRPSDSHEDSSVDDSYSEAENDASSSEASASSSQGRRPTFDPVDLSTRGAPLRSSLGQPQPARSAKPRVINEDPDASPPPFSNRNEKSMAALKRGMGVPEEFRPAVRKGKLFMEEVRSGELQTGDGAGDGGGRRPKRVRGWNVGV
ncbi:hypothetical protein MMC10_000341 [Thelotrema lepadinum]|nr:hypothetical protein [Thelotrema lepadinum]